MDFGELYIFLDTNVLECRLEKSYLCLSQLQVHKDVYDIFNFVNEWQLNTMVHICIPDIVWREIKQHLRECYQSAKEDFDNLINVHQKVWGNLLNVNYEYKIPTIDAFQEHIEAICQVFLQEQQCQIISYEDKIQLYETLVCNAIQKVPPFQNVKHSRKNYSDAGLKDAIIFETIQSYVPGDAKGIFFTNDSDFNIVKWRENITCLSSKDDIIKYISTHYNISSKCQVKEKLKESYNKETVLRTIEIDPSSINDYDIDVVDPIEGYDGVFEVNVHVIQQEKILYIRLQYDMNSNNISDVELYDDDDQA